MSYKVRQPSLAGRIGTGIGQGLAEQIPKEIERYRLSSGLQNFAQNSQNLSPIQQIAQLSSIPGVTPQMIQTMGELARQQAKANSFQGQGAGGIQPQVQAQPVAAPPQFPAYARQTVQPQGSLTPSITREEPLAKTQEGYIPPALQARYAEAERRFNDKPAFYGNDPQQAITEVDKEVAIEESRQQAYETLHQKLSTLQDNAIRRLRDQSSKLNVQVPEELYNDIENEMINATKSKKEGGRGLTEQQAIKEFGDKLNDASRDFSKIDEIGKLGIKLRPASTTLRTMKQLQQKFEKLGQTDNFAKYMISRNGLSPKFAYSIAEPLSRDPTANKIVRELPDLEKISTFTEEKTPPAISIPKTREIAPKLAELLSKNNKISPLAIAYEIEKKGYDPETFLQYLTDNASKLNLKQRQTEQIATPNNLIGTWNDWWLSSWSGIE